MASIRSLQLFILEKTFNKIKSDFTFFENQISTDKKSNFKEKTGYEGFYGSWNHFYLNDDYKNRDILGLLNGKTNPIQSFTSEQVDLEHPVFEQMIKTLLDQEKSLNKLTEENFRIHKLKDGEEPLLKKNEINVSMLPAIIHDVISIAQNNATISQLLKDFIYNLNIKSLIKAVSIDASVTSIEEINKQINSLPIPEQINLEKKLIKAKQKPIYSPNGNNQTIFASIFINQFDNVGLFNAAFNYSDTDVYELALKYGAISIDIDESTFLKKLRAYKKIKSQGRE